MASDGDVVYLPVPQSLYADVIGFLAERLGGEDGELTPAPKPNGRKLDEELVYRIYAESLDTHRRLFKILAGRAGEWVPYSEISDAMGYDTARSLPGTLGALGRRAKHRYDGIWPFDPRWTGERWEARMEPWVAEIIAEL